MPGAAARILVAAAVPGLAPGAAGLVRAAAAVRAAVAAAPAQGLLLAPAVDLVARRIRERARRRRRRSAATALRRTRIAAGAGAAAAAPRVKRARKRGKRARRGSPGLALGLAPGLVLDLVLHLELRISQGNLSQRAARSPRAMTRAASLREAHALVLVPVLSLLRSPNPEPGLNQSPNPVPPHLPKPAPVPAPPPDRSPALNPAPSLVLVPVLAPSSDFGLFVTSPPPSVSLLPSIYIPRARQHYPHLLFFDK